MTNRARLHSIILGIFLGFAPSIIAQTPPAKSADAQRPWMDTSLPIDQRVDALIGQMTLEEKVQQMRDHAPAIPRLGVPKYDWWNEGLHGVAFSGYATNFPQVIGMAATWDAPLVHRMARDHLHRGARQVQPGHARERSRGVLRAYILGAQHQHLSRSAMGPRPGDLRRRSVPDRPDGGGLRQRHAGRRSRSI